MGAIKPWHIFLGLCTCGSVAAVIAAVLVVVLRKK
jgi:hypothetical protein